MVDCGKIQLKKYIDESQVWAHGAGPAALGDDLHDFIRIPDDGASQVGDGCILKDFLAQGG